MGNQFEGVDSMNEENNKKSIDFKDDKYLAFQMSFFAAAILINYFLPRQDGLVMQTNISEVNQNPV